MSQVSSTAKLKCAQLQIPGGGDGKQLSGGNNDPKRNKPTEMKLNNANKYNYKYLFEDNFDKLRNYIHITSDYKHRIKSFSTSDISEQIDPEPATIRKYMSECDLNNYLRVNSKEITNDYITYSCSTLAICGDTIHSSQLPSPQTQSIRQLNSFMFSDLDLIKSINRKVRNLCIKRRIVEFMKCIDLSSLQENEIDIITKITSNVSLKPFKLKQDIESKEYITDQGDILVQVINCSEEKPNCVTRHDKEMFVLNWLQTVEPCTFDPEWLLTGHSRQ